VELGKIRDDHKQLQRQVGDFTKLASDRAAVELPALRAGAIFAKVVEAHADVLQLPQEDVLNRLDNLSAEVTSTAFLAANRLSGFGGGLDPGRVRIVLLASDTAIGLFCAHVNASLLHQFLVRPACNCGARFDDFTNGSACAAVRIRVVPGMEARRLETIYPNLEKVCREEAEGCERIKFNITGGYKGAVPAITWLAGGFFGTRAELFYQHETALAATRFTFSAAEQGHPGGIVETIWPSHQ
jgi:hypothetical protein